MRRPRLTPPQDRAIARVFRRSPKVISRLAQLYGLCERAIFKAARRGGNQAAAPVQQRVYWSDADLARLKARYADMRTDRLALELGKTTDAVYRFATKLGLAKSAAYLSGPECSLNKKGNAGSFKKGLVSFNKGKKGITYPGCVATQFRKGERSGKAAEHYMPIGAERDIEGQLWVKVADVPNVAYTVNWKAWHVLVWERANGRPLPAGHVLRFGDNDHRNFDVANLELLSFADNMRRNTIHRYPPELRRVIRLQGKLTRAIENRESAPA